MRHIEDKLNLEDKVPYLTSIVINNDPGLNKNQFKSLMKRLNIQIYYCTLRQSTSNGQIERGHSALIEITRCLKQKK